MDSLKDAVVIHRHNQLRTAERHVAMSGDNPRKAYGRIDFRVTPLAGGRATAGPSGHVGLESKA
jgi:hypothetical protein